MNDDTWTQDDTIWLVTKTVLVFIGVIALGYVIFRFVQARRRGEPSGRALIRALGEALPSAGMLALGSLMVGGGAALLYVATELWRGAQDPVLMIFTFGLASIVLFSIAVLCYAFGAVLIGFGVVVLLGGGGAMTGFWAARRARKRGAVAAPVVHGQWEAPPPVSRPERPLGPPNDPATTPGRMRPLRAPRR